MSRAENLSILHRVAATRSVSPEMLTMLEHIMAAESGGKQYAANPNSSARGAFQFIEDTWLGNLKKHGAKFGQGQFAEHIHQVRNGDGKLVWTIDDHALRKQALDLRYDAAVSSEMAIAFTRDNQQELVSALGREPSAGELYLAHFLGSGGAKKVLQHPDPNAPISSLLGSKVMNANESVKLVRGGKTTMFNQFTIADIQQWSANKMQQELSYEQLSEQNRRASWRRRNPRAVAPGQEDDYSDQVESLGEMSMVETIIQFVVGILTALGSILGITDEKTVSAPLATPVRQAAVDVQAPARA